jgi:hypothetical protein
MTACDHDARRAPAPAPRGELSPGLPRPRPQVDRRLARLVAPGRRRDGALRELLAALRHPAYQAQLSMPSPEARRMAEAYVEAAASHGSSARDDAPARGEVAQGISGVGAGRRSRRLVGVAWALVALPACSAPPGPAQGAGGAVDPWTAVELIPTSSGVISGCAAELGATFCSPTDALAAEQACSARLTPAEQAGCDPASGCLVPYAPTRPGPCVPGPTYTSLTECATPVLDSCAFYRSCLEEAHPCGAGGYALGFGEPLCYLFIDHRDAFTPAGQRWLSGVRTCLQRALAPLVSSPVASCDALADEAYASHTSCYTAPDNSFCALAPPDVTALAGLLFPYLDDPKVIAQVHAVNAICADAGP